MLNIEVNRRAEGVERYFDRELAVSDYLMKEPGVWAGRDETMCAMEAEMQRKVRKGGLDEDRRTGEMLYSKFFHRDSRPINGLRFFAGSAAKKWPLRGSRSQASRESEAFCRRRQKI